MYRKIKSLAEHINRRARHLDRPRSGPYIQNQNLDEIEFWQVPTAMQAPVRDWFEGRAAALELNGGRSVFLPHPAGGGRLLKLKGSGHFGGPVRFGQFHDCGPKAPVFDFEGRMMEDVASGHDGAFRGGLSFQQAITEFRMTSILTELGYAVMPCLGYGRVLKDGLSSWFVVLELEPGLKTSIIYPEVSVEEWIRLNIDIGVLLFDLAVKHDLIGYSWYAGTQDGRYLIKDLHPFRLADPFNMSQVSWVMQLFFALHIRGNGHRLNVAQWKDAKMPPDLHVWQYRCFYPEVRLEDHDQLRQELVAPYMLGPPRQFSFDRLLKLLRNNRITAALLEACPPKFPRP